MPVQIAGEFLDTVNLGGASAFSSASKSTTKTAVVEGAGTKSAILDCGASGGLVGVRLDAGFDGTALSFEVSEDGTNFGALNTSDGAVSLTVAASKCYTLDAATFFPWRYVKFVTSAQTGATTITAIVRVF